MALNSLHFADVPLSNSLTLVESWFVYGMQATGAFKLVIGLQLFFLKNMFLLALYRFINTVVWR